MSFFRRVKICLLWCFSVRPIGIMLTVWLARDTSGELSLFIREPNYTRYSEDEGYYSYGGSKRMTAAIISLDYKSNFGGNLFNCRSFDEIKPGDCMKAILNIIPGEIVIRHMDRRISETLQGE